VVVLFAGIVDLSKDLIRLSGFEPEREIEFIFTGNRSVVSGPVFCYYESAMKERIPQAPESEIISCLQAELPAILKGRPVMLAYLFGSVAEGTALPSSDVDIALVLEPKLGGFDMLIEYINRAITKAVYEKLEDGTYSGKIPQTPGVIAFADTLYQCQEELRAVLEGWLIVKMRHSDKLPSPYLWY
jgi:predicted RNase H-like HicB family nuclease